MSPLKVHFLDMWVLKHEGKLKTTLFTDRNTLLLATSFDPSPLKPKSQLYWLRRICYSDYDFIAKSLIMKNRFLDRGYPPKWVNDD